MALQTDVIYIVRDRDGGTGVAVSTDGVGAYWYDTVAEAEEQHGDRLPIISIRRERFEDLR